jgi:hypothetical protein
MLYQSGLEGAPGSVSSFFDVQYRQQATATSLNINNETYQKASFRFLASRILSDSWAPVEGLIVDYKTGGIGFRNHTAPANLQLGAEWNEDLLFWTPETACVDTNLTLRSQQALPPGSGIPTMKQDVRYLVDQGGFTDLNRISPQVEWGWGYGSDVQKNPRLRDRAYAAAWLNNVLTMYFMNISDPNTNRSRISSSIGDQYELDSNDFMTRNEIYSEAFTYNDYDVIASIPSGYGYGDLPVNVSNSTHYVYSADGVNTTVEILWPNPYNISNANFTDSGPMELCRFFLGGDQVNTTNLDIACGTLYSSGYPPEGPRQQTPEPGSKWDRKIYSCASATKVSLKTVRFFHNTTGIGLSKLQILNITDKVYENHSAQPLWAMEQTTPQMNLSEIYPLYGLINPSLADRAINLTTLPASPHIYIPASYSSTTYGSLTTLFSDTNLASIAGPGAAWEAAYDTLPSTSTSNPVRFDYTGRSDLAMSEQWVALTANATGAAHMLNLLWTDIAANAFVGTRSWLTKGTLPPNLADTGIPALREDLDARQAANTSGGGGGGNSITPAPANTQDLMRDDAVASVPVYVYEHRVRYRWVYAIPALLCLALATLICAGALVAVVLGGTVGRVRYYMQRLSTGRVLGAFLYPTWRADLGRNAVGSDTREWIALIGRRRVRIEERVDVGDGAKELYVGETGVRTWNAVEGRAAWQHEGAVERRKDRYSRVNQVDVDQ